MTTDTAIAGEGGFEIIEHVRIPMPDGVGLSARLWLPGPARRQPVPVVLELIPYRKRDAYRQLDEAWGRVLASAGVAFARVDVRGTGDSEGVLTDEYSDAELGDGESCIEWLAGQHWCNGSVGLRGISWGGINTLMIAARAPAALKAVVSMAAADNRFTDDAHYIGGLPAMPNLEWGVQFKTVLAGPPDPSVVGENWAALWKARLEASPAVVTEWLRHRTFDDYWQRDAVCLDPSAIRTPVYLVAGWQDTYVNFVKRLFDTLSVPVRALIGPWGHTYPGFARPQSVDWEKEEVRWWRHWLMGEDTGLLDEPPLRVHLPVETARQRHPEPLRGSWRLLPDWPQSERRYHIAPAGLLDTIPETRAAPIRWQETVPVGLCSAAWLEPLPEEQSPDDAHSLCFETRPLAEGVAVLGRPRLSLSLRMDSGRVIAARLTDVDPEGRSWLVGYAVLDLTFREGFERMSAFAPGQLLTPVLELPLLAHEFRKGHRLRLALSGGLWPLTWPAAEPAAFTLDPSACSLTLPVTEPGPTDSVTAVSVGERVRAAPPPAPLPSVARTANGGYRYEAESEPYEYRVESPGTRLSGGGGFVAELDRDRASRWRSSARRGWHRDGWDCEVAAEARTERTADGIVVEESLRAFQDGRLIFERRSTERLKSGH